MAIESQNKLQLMKYVFLMVLLSKNTYACSPKASSFFFCTALAIPSVYFVTLHTMQILTKSDYVMVAG